MAKLTGDTTCTVTLARQRVMFKTDEDFAKFCAWANVSPEHPARRMEIVVRACCPTRISGQEWSVSLLLCGTVFSQRFGRVRLTPVALVLCHPHNLYSFHSPVGRKLK